MTAVITFVPVVHLPIKGLRSPYKNKHETSSSSCGGAFGNTKTLFIFLLITLFVIVYLITSFVIAYLITSFAIAYLII